jgi:AcrR family transcriptional regulator
MVAAARHALDGAAHETVKVTQVARTAGVALGTLYRYFPSKDRLYAEVLLEWASGLHNYRPPGADGIARLRARLGHVTAACRRNPHLVGAETALRLSADPDTQAVIAQVDRAGYDGPIGELAPRSPVHARRLLLTSCGCSRLRFATR